MAYQALLIKMKLIVYKHSKHSSAVTAWKEIPDFVWKINQLYPVGIILVK